MKIIDTHAHIFPDKIAQKAVKSISDFYDGTVMTHIGSSEELIKSGNAIGVEKYLVFSTATAVHQVESINSFIIEQTKQYEQFIGLGTMFTGYENFENVLNRLKDNGINGIKLHPEFQRFNFDSQELYPLFDALVSMNMFVLTHAGDYRFEYSHPHRIAKIAKAFPGLNIIAAHFGGWSQWDIALNCLNLPNVYVDTSSTIEFDGDKYAKRAFEIFDNSHIFFGTDYPMWDHEKELENIKRLGLSEEVFENIMYNNFCEFYRMYDNNQL